MMEKDFIERPPVCEAHEAGDVIQFLLRFWETVRLLILNHLQTVFELAQEVIGCSKIGCRRVGDQSRDAQGLDCLQRLSGPQRGIATTQDELLGLCKELDLTDSPAPELDIV